MHAIIEKDLETGAIVAIHGPFYYKSSIDKALADLEKEGKKGLVTFEMKSASSFLLNITHDLAAAGTALMRHSRALRKALDAGDIKAAQTAHRDLQASLEFNMGKVIQRITAVAADELP